MKQKISLSLLLGASLAANVAWAIGGPGGPPPNAPTPEEGNTFFGFVEDQELFDSNLFRLPNDGRLPPGSSKSDTINTITVGGYAQWYLGRQLFQGNIAINHGFYAHNSELDNTGGDANLKWDWVVGPYFSGTVGGEYQHSLASFQETLYTGRDLVDFQNYFGTGRYQLGPHWALEGGVHESRYEHSADAARNSNLRVATGNAGIEFDYNVGNSFTLEYNYADGKYPAGQFNTIGTIQFSPNYHDSQPRLNFKYVISDKTSINGYGGYLKRSYENTDIGAFSGDVWRIEGVWQATEKTQFNLAVWHELHAYLAAQANYFISKGVSFAPAYVFSSRLTAYLTLSYEDQDYIPSNTNVVTDAGVIQLGNINAKAASGTLSAVYSPIDALVFNFLYQHSQRSSNQEIFRFGDNYAYVSAAFKFR